MEGTKPKDILQQSPQAYPCIMLPSTPPANRETAKRRAAVWKAMRKGSASRCCMPPLSAGVTPIVQRVSQSARLPFSYSKTTDAVQYVEIRRHCRKPTVASTSCANEQPVLAVSCLLSHSTLWGIAEPALGSPLGLWCLSINRVCRCTWAYVTCEGMAFKIDLALHVCLYHGRLILPTS